MIPTVVLTRHAAIKLQTLDSEETLRILDAVTRIAADPSSPSLRRLEGRDDTHVCSVGTIRVVLRLEGDQVTVLSAFRQDEIREFSAGLGAVCAAPPMW